MSSIRLLTAASGKAGEQKLTLDDLAAELEGVQSGWLDIMQPGDAEKEFLLETMGSTHWQSRTASLTRSPAPSITRNTALLFCAPATPTRSLTQNTFWHS